jgi:Putative MetA-pathway of phenol degradation
MAGRADGFAAVRIFAGLLLLVPAPLAAQPVPTASTADAPICTDRPTKSNFACTVPKGLVQIEADGFTWLTNTAGGIRSDQLLFSNPTFKYGLTGSSDIQINWVPFTRVRSRDAAGTVSSRSGIGDTTLRFKQRLTGAAGAFQLALLPFVKLPTARAGIGNGRLEGGIAVPANISVPGGWTVTLGPQLDLLADFDGRGRHLGFTGLVNIAKQFGAFTLYSEIWTSQNFDPAGTVRQYSYDASLAWLMRPTLQFDVGANVGLNRDTPDLVAYVGVSTRF